MTNTGGGFEAVNGARIAVVMPVYNGEAYLVRSLPPLIAMLQRGEVASVVVVDDTSTDGSAAFAAGLGATVMPSGGRLGPGAARNVAAAVLDADILWFIDADVVASDTCAVVIRDAFRDPRIVAVFGLYDDRPPAENFGSQYKNLVHHFYHRHAVEEASTFWSGCGAVRTGAFVAAGGFDAETYRVPSIEDIDLGYRLRDAGGRIRLDRRLLCTHLKIWSVPELVRTDIFRRAVPWSRLMLRRADVLDDLNVASGERARAVFAALALATVLAALLAVLPWWTAPVAVVAVIAVNWDLFRLFADARGLLFALAGIGFHQIYYVYSSAAFAWCWLERFGDRRKAAA